MANRFTTFRKYNKNRFKKIYPINHFPAVDGYWTDKGLVVESSEVKFSAEGSDAPTESVTFRLEGNYSKIPTIVFSGYANEDDSMSNVNLFISNISLVSGRVEVTIESSAPWYGNLSVQALEVG